MTNIEYINGALRTEAPVTPEMVARFAAPETAVLLLSAIHAIITQGKEMERLKKHLFSAAPLPTFGSRQNYIAPAIAERLNRPGTVRLLHATIGLATESAEMMEAVYAHLVDGAALDYTNLIEEAGDHFWFLALLSDTLATTFDDIMRRNVNKLRTRFADKFSESESLNRNLPAERAQLERTE